MTVKLSKRELKCGGGYGASSQIHAENTDTWVVFDTQVNVLLYTESKVSSLGEVARAVSAVVLESTVS